MSSTAIPILKLITDGTGQRLYTTSEAAVYLGVHVGHIRKLVQRGDLKPKKKGRDLLLSKETLDHYKEKRRPRGRPIQPTRSKRVAKEREAMREYMKDYRQRKATTKKTGKPTTRRYRLLEAKTSARK